MADTDSSHVQRLVSDTDIQIPQNQSSPTKLYSHFIYKSALVAFLVLLPLFPSQAPDFFNKTLLTRGWELIHLLFVGIAVSYGLFSRRNDESEKENQSKLDNTQTYVSRILQVSSIFDDEIESPFGFEDNNKIQTWNSNYFRGDPMVVVAKENSVIDEESKKPLFLPVRSLRSRVSDSNALESINEPVESSGLLSRSSSGKSNFSSSSFRKTRNEEIESLDQIALEEKLNESVVLPSPIPWRSRSGRMEMKEEIGGGVSPPLYSLPPSVEESEFVRPESRNLQPLSSKPNSASPSPKKLSPSPSLSPEMRAKKVEDLGRKKSFHKASPPPPPPPPPPPFFNTKSPSITSKTPPITDAKRSFKNDLKDHSRNNGRDSGMDYLNSDDRSRTHMESPSMGKSIQTNKTSKSIVETKKVREVGDDQMEERGRKMGGFDQPLIDTEKLSREIPRPTSKPSFSKYQKEEKKEFAEKVILESEEDDFDSEDESIEESSDFEETISNNVSDAGPDPYEVDKKADEFIAKFREQIRLQRIESIKKSSGQHNRRNSSR